MRGPPEFRLARWISKRARRIGFDPAACRRIEDETRAHVLALLARGCPPGAVRVRYVHDVQAGDLSVMVEPAEGVAIAPEVVH